MKIEVLPDAVAVATRAARLIATVARAAVAERGRFALAVSGGKTPWQDADLRAAAARYAADLHEVAGLPPELDLVHLGLGPDGHTASLVPGDPVLSVSDADVAPTGEYQGRRRLTLTYPVLNRARQLLWIVTGADKAPALPRLVSGDPSIPAGRVRADRALLLADAAAAAALPLSC